MKNNQFEQFDDGYYHLASDLEAYPDAWCIIVYSKRGPGKTYSALWNSFYNKIPILYMKRTIDDVKAICSNKNGFDLSPYVPINRDKGTDIMASYIDKGIGGFYHTDGESGKPEGAPISYIAALNAVKSIKGFDMSEVEWILLDEFIPQSGEIVRHAEGDMLLDLYMTISRDRQKRGRKPLKLILFANAEEISTPITNALEVVDVMAELSASGKSHYYDEARGIMIHHITDEEVPIREEEKDGIYNAMAGTAWGRKAFGGEFTNNDFTNVRRRSLKGAQPLIEVHYKNRYYYIYILNNGDFYMCRSRQNCPQLYDLNLENDQKRFYVDWIFDLREACIEDRFKFEQYSMYDLIIDYTKFFKI